MKILLTGPTLETKKKIAGIATVVQLIMNNPEVEYDYFKVGRDLTEGRNFKWLLKQIKDHFKFKKLLTKNFDIIHLNSCLSHVAIIRDYWYIKISSRNNNKIILHLHGGEYLFKQISNKILRYFIKKNYQRVSTIIVLSDIEKQNSQFKPFINKVFVLPNAIGEEYISKKLLQKKHNSIVFLGRIDDNKGIKEIYNALSDIKKEVHFKFYLYGDGTLRKEYVRKFREVLKDKFEFGGIINNSKKWEVLRNNEFFILPSKYEGLPMALLEAMASGCIPLVTNVGSMGDVVKETHNGFILYDNNFTAKIKTALNLSEDEKKNLSYNAIDTIKDNYSMTEFYNSINKIYKGILNNY